MVDVFLLRLRTGPRKTCEEMLRKLTTTDLQGLEHQLGRDARFTPEELDRARRLINSEVLARVERGNVV